jgi:hypothetical protein
MQLYDCASVIRSKNAGPLTLTIDVFFDDQEMYARARVSSLLTTQGVASAYGVEPDTISGIYWSEGSMSVKVSMSRWSSVNDPFCTDIFGAHLHVPLSQGEV